MKKTLLIAGIVFVFTALTISATSAQSRGPGMRGPGYGYDQQGQQGQWNYCPNCGACLNRGGGGYGMGYGMMGRGYGHGMMGRGYHMGPGMMGPQYGPQYGQQRRPGDQGYRYGQPSEPLDASDAEKMMNSYLGSVNNPNLELGEIKDEGEYFEARIQTKDGSLVDRIQIDKDTGWMRSAY